MTGKHSTGGSHIIDGEFQSDKYPTTPRGKVPLSVKDPTAQDLLWKYAQRRRVVDAEFAADLETCLRAAGYTPPVPHDPTDELSLVANVLEAGVREIQRRNADIGNYRAVNDSLSRQLYATREMLRGRTEDMASDLAAAQRRIAELESDQRIRTLTMERDSLISQLDHVRKVSLDSSQAAYLGTLAAAGLARDLAAAQRKIAELEAIQFRSPNDARQAVKDACLSVARTAATAVPIEKLDLIIDLAVGRLAQADETAARQQLAAAQRRIAELEAERDAARNPCLTSEDEDEKQVRFRLEEWRSNYATTAGIIERWMLQRHEMQARITELERACDAHAASGDEANDRVSAARQRIAELEAALAGANQEIVDVMRRLEGRLEEENRAAEPDIRDEDDDESGFVPWPDGQPPRYNGSGEPCDMWIGPCCCGATHSVSERQEEPLNATGTGDTP